MLPLQPATPLLIDDGGSSDILNPDFNSDYIAL
jgi:hypothetical protein